MDRRHLQIEVPGKGIIAVLFVLEHGVHQIDVTNIQINSDFGTGLPTSAELIEHDRNWVLSNGENPPVLFNDEYAQIVVKKILEERDNAKVSFLKL
jgi:hypothetical protein